MPFLVSSSLRRAFAHKFASAPAHILRVWLSLPVLLKWLRASRPPSLTTSPWYLESMDRFATAAHTSL